MLLLDQISKNNGWHWRFLEQRNDDMNGKGVIRWLCLDRYYRAFSVFWEISPQQLHLLLPTMNAVKRKLKITNTCISTKVAIRDKMERVQVRFCPTKNANDKLRFSEGKSLADFISIKLNTMVWLQRSSPFNCSRMMSICIVTIGLVKNWVLPWNLKLAHQSKTRKTKQFKVVVKIFFMERVSNLQASRCSGLSMNDLFHEACDIDSLWGWVPCWRTTIIVFAITGTLTCDRTHIHKSVGRLNAL